MATKRDHLKSEFKGITTKGANGSHSNVRDLAAASVAHNECENGSSQSEAIAMLKNVGAAAGIARSVVAMKENSADPKSLPSFITSTSPTSKKKVLNTKRAEQNRKAQQAFRRKRGERFRELEKKAQLVDHYREIIQSLKNEIVTLREYTLTLQSRLIEHGDGLVETSNNLPAVLSRAYLGKLDNLGNLNVDKDDKLGA
ncbi:AP-1-like transcription factor [Komagataella phaffii CBS 7435]|uniref:Putative transcription factor kapC n=2 Tax=Komagataella phaffii TaxID=460519 RepID=C4R981_KOMPG|nr:transcription factor [Komagataella phaffii GS115]AOA64446.1 GQ67_05352T0 [Komagataella phaffii]CAH2450375.1 AP-1-like transcription factor [Komagataella phaffii CBS 7435]AOA69759.1 GQ68_05261T0 [Komagataella phaffii GS115]CAY72156.1 transcription factor [Komagataella phaffii GS115]CCA40245.1 AP-1-like transcription factor [Komagataella phaffii CBS 7435]